MEVHAPPQVMHVQAPFTHVCPVAQALPQPPQFWSSAIASRQLPPQQAGSVPEQAVEQEPQLWMSSGTSAPLQQSCPVPHFTPHEPQWLQSREKSAHVPEQQAGESPPQALPHDPQWWTSLWNVAGSTHAPSQHDWTRQTFPQPPQFQKSLFSSTQAPPQHDWPGPHAAMSVQSVPHDWGCVRSTQTPPQQFRADPSPHASQPALSGVAS
jgi:hypothetical protein